MKENTNNLPKISVVTITYGHQDYILDTIKGVLKQDYNGPIEFIIANDNSPDQTDTIVKQFFNENILPPNIDIRYTKHAINKGMTSNFIWALQQVTGDYIALCEGDDYWIDTLKLQKQVDFLDIKSDYVMVFSNATLKQASDMQVGLRNGDVSKDYDSRDIYMNWSVPTASVIFKKSSLYESRLFSFENESILYPDLLLYLCLSEVGKLYRIVDEMVVYRIHKKGAVYQIRQDKDFFVKTIEHHLLISRSFHNLRTIAFRNISDRYILLFRNNGKFMNLINYNYYLFKSSISSFFSILNIKINIKNVFSRLY